MQGSVGIAVMGASGRMGRMLIEVINDSAAAHLVAVTERPGHDWAGRDLGEAMGGAATGVPVHADPIDAIVNAQAVIDFTTPDATVDHALLTAQARCVHVIGTTGFAQEHLDKLEQFTPDQLKAKANILSVSGATVNWATGCNYTDAEKEYIEAAMPISKWAIEVPLILAEAAVLAADGASVTLIKSILKGR